MPKLVQKCGYIRNGSAAKYMRYIATREGVEKLHGRGPVTQPQKELIERLLKDYPDKEAARLFRTTVRIRSLAVLRPAARLPKCCPRTSAPARCSPAL